MVASIRKTQKSAGAPLSAFRLFQTGDVDRARALVAGKFCAHRLHTFADHRAFDATQHHVAGRLLSLNYIRYGATVLIEPGELTHFYLIQIPLAGGADITNGTVCHDSDREIGAVLNPDRETRMIWHGGCEQLLIHVSRPTMMALAEKLVGRSLSAPVVFTPSIDFASPAQAAWRRQLLALAAAADTGHLFQDAVADHEQAALEEQLLVGFLTHQPSNITPFIETAAASPVAYYVRRADDYLRSHASEPVTLSDIAGAAGVSIRTLQLGYRKAYGMSPMQALKRERLMQVRHALESGHADSTVSALAAVWGFSHFGRFAKDYRQAFGSLPAEALRHACQQRGRPNV